MGESHRKIPAEIQPLVQILKNWIAEQFPIAKLKHAIEWVPIETLAVEQWHILCKWRSIHVGKGLALRVGFFAQFELIGEWQR